MDKVSTFSRYQTKCVVSPILVGGMKITLPPRPPREKRKKRKKIGKPQACLDFSLNKIYFLMLPEIFK